MRRLCGMALLGLVLTGCGSSDMDQTARDFMAYDACTDAVSQQLKAPGSADFQGKLDVDYDNSGNGDITVVGWVDAENSFGAKLRTHWTCSTNVDKNGNVGQVLTDLG
jgi:hypothetical protein